MSEAKNLLFVINDGPYGSERAYNALRMALNVVKRPGTKVRVFLVSDAVGCARRGQATPEGYYNVERMLKGLVNRADVAT